MPPTGPWPPPGARPDYAAMSELMAASHRSMRDDFAITLPEIDALVETMANSIGTSGGARMTGGGFGGCVVAVIADSSRDPLESALAAHWAKLGRVSPLQTIVAPAQGARLL
jgi:galactokinase